MKLIFNPHLYSNVTHDTLPGKEALHNYLLYRISILVTGQFLSTIIIHSLAHLFYKYLLSAYSSPDTLKLILVLNKITVYRGIGRYINIYVNKLL